jgi:hypothetical protein
VYLEEQEALGKARAQEAVSAHVSLFTSLTSTAGKDSKGQRAAGKSFKGNIGGKSLKGNIGAKSFKVKKSHVVSGGDAHGCPPDGGKRHGAQEHHTGPVVQSLEHCLQPPAEAAWQGRSSGGQEKEGRAKLAMQRCLLYHVGVLGERLAADKKQGLQHSSHINHVGLVLDAHNHDSVHRDTAAGLPSAQGGGGGYTPTHLQGCSSLERYLMNDIHAEGASEGAQLLAHHVDEELAARAATPNSPDDGKASSAYRELFFWASPRGDAGEKAAALEEAAVRAEALVGKQKYVEAAEVAAAAARSAADVAKVVADKEARARDTALGLYWASIGHVRKPPLLRLGMLAVLPKVRSGGGGLRAASSSSSSIYWHSNLVTSSDWLRMLAHLYTLTYMPRRWNFGSS